MIKPFLIPLILTVNLMAESLNTKCTKINNIVLTKKAITKLFIRHEDLKDDYTYLQRRVDKLEKHINSLIQKNSVSKDVDGSKNFNFITTPYLLNVRKDAGKQSLILGQLQQYSIVEVVHCNTIHDDYKWCKLLKRGYVKKEHLRKIKD